MSEMWSKSPHRNNYPWNNHAAGSWHWQLCSGNCRWQNRCRSWQFTLSGNRHRNRRSFRHTHRGRQRSRSRKHRRQTHRRKRNAGVPLQQLQLPMESSIMRCPDCNSDDIIPWDDGYICRDCGLEFDDPKIVDYPI